jgi:hypothetical protein
MDLDERIIANALIEQLQSSKFKFSSSGLLTGNTEIGRSETGYFRIADDPDFGL